MPLMKEEYYARVCAKEMLLMKEGYYAESLRTASEKLVTDDEEGPSSAAGAAILAGKVALGTVVQLGVPVTMLGARMYSNEQSNQRQG